MIFLVVEGQRSTFKKQKTKNPTVFISSLSKSWFWLSLSIRYNHDSSETIEDYIEFIATDGTNSVSFVLQVKVIEIDSLMALHSWSFFAVR